MPDVNYALRAEGLKKLKALKSRLNELERHKAEMPFEEYIRERSMTTVHIESIYTRYKIKYRNTKHND